MDTQVNAPVSKSLSRTGWILLALALVTPTFMGAAGILSAFKVGELTFQVGFAWLVAAVVIDLLTKKRDVVGKASGRIVAGLLALVVALASGASVYRDTQKIDLAKQELIEQFMRSSVEAKTATPQTTAPAAQKATELATQQMTGASESDKTVEILRAMKIRAKEFAEESGAIDRKFDSVDVSTVLLAQNLISMPSIDASNKKINFYKTTIAERDAMLKKHVVLSEQIIRGSGLSEREVNDGIAGLNSNITITKNYADLTKAQLTSLKATEDILTFAQRGLGRITVENGQLMFQTQPELDEYRRLFQVLTDAATTETAITQKVTAQAQKSKQALVDQLK